MSVAAIIGGGVIGGGWAARFLAAGWDVRVFDPDPEAGRKLDEVLANARRAAPGLSAVSGPAEGKLSLHGTISEAVAGAAWVQESVPERLELKRKVFQQIQAHGDPEAVIGSSTSGFRPSQLQGCATRAGQIMVAHPFNPVYLLPLVELVTTDANPAPLVACAKDILSEIGMKPLHLRREIDAHIADRLMEAVWREGLWLVKDGIASTEEIDDAIRFGFGLRWAQMGLFETFRIAGGEAGMRHFIAQFGPCLEWPWTKLMDVPDLTDELVETIADQSDAQSGAHSIRELERIRDSNLVAIMRALKWADWGVGALLNEQDRRRAPDLSQADLARPIRTMELTVPLDWTDYNGHMNEARYLETFSRASDRFMEMVGVDADYVATGGSYFTTETHLRHLGEARAGDPIRVETTLLEGGGKKMHLFQELYHAGDGRLLATGEHMLLHVSLETRRTSPPADGVAARLAEIAAHHAKLPPPDDAGRGIGAAR
ncbi:carnitine 3-dehydrogenase [Maritimibacter sp. 55A14]|uniref:carnitine 3-dehydrogenase n=1 Tax=Maritimibacter sp. 55A14 TaxID=2174844 RepID=UPI000D61A2D1|nr:carnitine 3-dehydrogenase [Maritimibacter sp. 55A14]PWE33850.1 carnitine 3-dehydrogenase [Maritimibacter sp. 55A14]